MPRIVDFSARICLSDCGVLEGFLKEFLRVLRRGKIGAENDIAREPHPLTITASNRQRLGTILYALRTRPHECVGASLAIT
jgi:hypothetical protein